MYRERERKRESIPADACVGYLRTVNELIAKKIGWLIWRKFSAGGRRCQGIDPNRPLAFLFLPALAFDCCVVGPHARL
eukprot:1871197-Rhodomonas_salina.2